MQTKLRSSDSFDRTSADSDSLALLMEIKGVAYKFESQKNIYLALDNAKSACYAYRQASNETNAMYMSKFRNAIDVIEHYGGNIGNDTILVTEELKKIGESVGTAGNDKKKEAIKLARKKAHAMAFLKRADRARYALLIMDLENQFTRGNDQYPVSITETYNLLVNYKKPAGPGRERNNKRTEGGGHGHERTQSLPPPTANTGDEMSFLQNEGNSTTPPIATIQCYNCQEMGHYAGSCPNDAAPRQYQLLQTAIIEETDGDDDTDDDEDIHFSFTQAPTHGTINPNWILLDSESTVSIFCNKKFLKTSDIAEHNKDYASTPTVDTKTLTLSATSLVSGPYGTTTDP